MIATLAVCRMLGIPAPELERLEQELLQLEEELVRGKESHEQN